MPVITVEMFEGRSRQQKERFAKAVAEAAQKLLKAPADHIWMIFKESPKENWAMGGKLCDAEKLPTA